MFRKTKIKIILTIMSGLVILWLSTMFFIYASYISVSAKKNYQMLVERAHMYVSSSFIEDESEDSPTTPETEADEPSIFFDEPEFELTTFYTVAFSDDGETFETQNDKPSVHSNEELEELAKKIVLENDQDVGVDGKLIYYHISKSSYELVVYMDNTIIIRNLTELFRYVWIYTGFAFVMFLILSVIFANVIVRPLEKGHKSQKEFISNAGHELKTPVSVISANTELLVQKYGEDQYLSNIQFENKRMGLLVGHLLELARTETVNMVTEKNDFSRIVNGEILPFESVAYEKGLNIHCNITPGIHIRGNSSQLKELVSILVDNAIEHCDNKSKNIQIVLSKELCKYAVLRVINSGKEIPKEDRKKIFERFYRTSNVEKTNDGHYGLGLAIAKNITTSHKGKIQLFCYDGKVEFRILLPLC